jgi:hypothetical protein
VSEATPHYSARVAAPAAEVLTAIKDAAEDWGASWEASDAGASAGGSLHLPVIAGLRRGFQEGRVTVEEGAGDAARSVLFEVERQSYRLWTPAIALLLVAAWGGVLSVIWPFWPHLLPYVPIGLVLAFSAWFLIVPRLRHEGAEEFLGMVSAYAEGAEGPEDEPGADPETPQEGFDLAAERSGDLAGDGTGDIPGELPGRWNGEVR